MIHPGNNKWTVQEKPNKPRRADCYSFRSRGTNRNKISSFLVCPESAVKNSRYSGMLLTPEYRRVFNRRRKSDEGRTKWNFSPLDLSGENMSSLREAEVGLRKWTF